MAPRRHAPPRYTQDGGFFAVGDAANPRPGVLPREERERGLNGAGELE